MSDALTLVWLCGGHSRHINTFIQYKVVYSKDSAWPEHAVNGEAWFTVSFFDIDSIPTHGIYRPYIDEECIAEMLFLGVGYASLLERPALSRNLILKAIDAGRVEL